LYQRARVMLNDINGALGISARERSTSTLTIHER